MTTRRWIGVTELEETGETDDVDLAAALMVRGHDAPTGAEVLAAYLRRPSWWADAACRGVGVDVFFPERGQSTAPAKALCAGCSVRSDCMAEASANDERWGIWAGLPAGKIRSAGNLQPPEANTAA